MTDEEIRTSIGRDGFVVIPDVVAPDRVGELTEAIEEARCQYDSRSASRAAHSMRNLLESVPSVADLAGSPKMRRLAEAVLGPDCFAVRGILFDKTPEANWKVPWHQDLSIAVKERIEVEGFGPWSIKDGVTHVLASPNVLAHMLTVRLHLDDCFSANGPLRVIPNTHLNPRMSAEHIEFYSKTVQTCKLDVVCECPSGGVLLMRPLLLHASSQATSPAHRRVIHIEYANRDLPNGLEWHTRLGGSAA